ncbi:hypothetical protein RB614_42660 [Phytohabitans sp. ZYX-F-186]|uniref:Alpha-L-rhamnosidase six-hairpin glycosidase domain-containing protein n=1 Tax=Phytohabitans maris TaxID=3071409 RepID=A0ABU0ZZ24_9ACTN|nr:hypothetical protein [Phytohabitans sp. ZYX-F-186]MDQ7911212.1 hypothetical protein [Phytohabitans sp. ZYX-F-186]
MTPRIIDHRYAPPSVWTAICHPDDPHKSLVREDGALMYRFHAADGRPQWWFGRVVEFGLATAHRVERVEQRTVDARTPHVLTTLHYPTATLSLCIFAHGGPGTPRYDVVLWELTVSPDVDSLLTGLHIDVHEAGIAERDLAPWQPVSAFPEGDTGTAALLVSVPDQLEFVASRGFLPARGMRTELAAVPGGKRRRGAIVLPIDGAPLDGIDLEWCERARAEETAYWAEVSAGWLPISVPDESVQDMLDSCVRNILQAREEVDGQLVFQVGSAVYRGLWMVDGHFLLEVAQYLHLADDARRGLQTILASAKPNGYLGVMDYIDLIKETGVGIAAVVRQWELTGDDGMLRDAWPVVRRGLAYIESLREQARALPPEHKAYALMPPAFPDGGSSGARPELTTALWTLHGIRAVLTAARHIAPEDVPAIAAQYDSLLADLRRVAERDMGRLPDGTPYLPIVLPGGSAHTHNLDGEAPIQQRIVPQTSTWALAHAIWPGEIFTPDDEIVRNYLALLDRIDDTEGIPEGAGFLPYRSLWTYYASFAAHAWLYAGRPDKAVDYLYDFANHASATRVWREEQSFADHGEGQVFGEMPHNWASAEFVRLVRHLLVFEVGETLLLLPGAPPEWLAAGEIRVDRTPTRFGPVSLLVTAGDRTIAVELPDGRGRLAECLLHVPEGTWTVTVDGTKYGDTVTGPVTVSLPRGDADGA